MTLTIFNDMTIPNSAAFQAWASSWHTAILSIGLVQTADTGQINFGTVILPGASQTKAGYAIYAFADSLQGTYPCFIRVDFGTSSSVSYPSLWFQVGTSTNGAGTLGVIQTTSIQFQQIGSAVYQSAVSGSTSRLTAGVSHTYTTSTYVGFLSIERLQTSTGTDSTTGLVFSWVKNYTGTSAFAYPGQQVLYFSGTQPLANFNSTGGLPTLFAEANHTSFTWTNGFNNVYVGLIYPVGQVIHYPIQGFMVNYPGDISPTSINVIPVYGVSQNWYSVPVANTTALTTNGVTGEMSLLVRWN